MKVLKKNFKYLIKEKHLYNLKKNKIFLKNIHCKIQL